jgi:sodium-dependent phosphate cotransporter
LYVFLVGVSTLEAGIKAMGSDFRDGLLESVENPLAGLFAGILATVLVQSSSVTTSTLVGLVGSGTLTLEAAAPMIMGANIGTTITNTLVSLGHVRRNVEFQRAFAAATMHDFFNLMVVSVFFPLEITTGFLTELAEWVADLLDAGGVSGGKTRSPVKEIVKAPVGRIEDALSSIISNEIVLGIVLLSLGLGLILFALTFLSRNMRSLIAGRVEQILNSTVSRGGGVVGIFTGGVITIGVQSSSITTSLVVPLVGSGVLAVRNAFPITLGANIGTTMTAVLASLAVDLRAGLVIALHHVMFNVLGVALFYPVPAIRYLPVRLAESLARVAVRNRPFVAVYVVGVFVIVPLIGIATLR